MTPPCNTIMNYLLFKSDERQRSSLRIHTFGQRPTYRKEDKEALVLLANTVVDPGTVMVHLADTAFTDTVEEEQIDRYSSL